MTVLYPTTDQLRTKIEAGTVWVVRVLYSFPHGLGRPGIGTTAYHQVSGLIREGLDVTVYCTTLHAELPERPRVVETLRVGSRRIPHRALGVWRAYRYHDRRAAHALTRSAYDIVHAWPAGCIATLQAAKRSGAAGFREAPNAHTAETFEVCAAESKKLGIELPRGHSHRHDERILHQELLEFAAAERLLVPSSYVWQSFVDRGIPSAALAEHVYGYDPSAFYPDPAWSSSRGRGLEAVFVGRGDLTKGLHYALEAWLASGAAETGRFTVVGELSPEYADILEGKLSHPSVELTGYVPNVGDYLRRADILLFPTITEGSALVTYEAQACGCVLLVSRAAGAACVPGTTALVHDVGDTATLMRQLRSLLDDPERLSQMRSATLQHAKTLTWAHAARRLAAIYRDARVARS